MYLLRTPALDGRVAALRGERLHSRDKDMDLKSVPDIKELKMYLLESVLQLEEFLIVILE
jgi:RNA polymerase II subunit A-like phosphatase